MARHRPTELRLLKQIICPYCWTAIKPHDVLWISEHADLRNDQRLGEDAFQRFLPTRFSPNGNAIDARGTDCHEMACPFCHLRLARDLLEVPVFFMSIFGAPSSGKTVYLASLTHALRQTMPLDFQITFQDTDPQDNVRIRRNESTLFDNSNPDSPSVVGELIDKTMQSGEEGGISLLHSVSFGNDVRQFPQPFMFTMQASDRHPMVNNQNGFARILCLYDNAGESFDPDPSQMEWELQTRHLSRSKLLLFTFDPTRDPRLQQRIREYSPGRLPNAVPGVAQEPYFQEAAKRIRKYAGLGRRDRHKAPLIIAVTKFDVWSDIIGEIDREAVPWRQVRVKSADEEDGQVAMAIDQRMIEDMSDRVKRLLMQTSPEIVSAAEALSEHVTYVPVSALGWNNAAIDFETTDGGLVGQYQVRPVDLKPYCVEIPVVYGLSKVLPGLVPVLQR